MVARGERRAPARRSARGRPRSRGPRRFVPSARRSCGSSSTTRMPGHVAASQPERPSSARRRACPRSRRRRPSPRRTPRDREAESDAVAVAGSRRAAGTGRNMPVAVGGGMPGPRSTTRRSTRRSTAPAVDARPARRGRLWLRALAMTLASARSSSPGSASTRRERLGDVDVDVGGSGAEARERGGDDLVDADRRQADVERAGLEPAHVEQVADERVEPVGLLVDRGEELASCLGRPVDVVLEQARHRRLDRRERRAQVVRDGGEERRAQLVGGGEAAGVGRLGLELARAASDDGELARRTRRGRGRSSAATDAARRQREHVRRRRARPCRGLVGASRGRGRRSRASSVQPPSVRWRTATASRAERSGAGSSRRPATGRRARRAARAPRPRRGLARRRRPGGRRARRSR